MIQRISDHATFAQLGRARRWSRGPLWIRAVPGPATNPPRVAYAIGKAFGGAVERNRLRRRLRAVFARRAGDLVPGGAYLVGAGPATAELDFEALDEAVAQLLARVRQELT
ncbi:MAG: ribonuclease P protein component [Acidimicrobiia bacterium]